MKKMKIMILLLSTFLTLQAPVIRYDDGVLIEQWKEAAELWYWQPLIKALVYVESRGDTFAYNEKEEAVGAFQIRQCRVSHFNRLKGTNYKLEDFFDYDLSKQMFLYFARGKSYEQASRNWNGKWSLTEIYWQKVKANLE